MVNSRFKNLHTPNSAALLMTILHPETSFSLDGYYIYTKEHNWETGVILVATPEIMENHRNEDTVGSFEIQLNPHGNVVSKHTDEQQAIVKTMSKCFKIILMNRLD